ncbi:hypothetical protein COJ96_02215 [Bacillus sp. AFS073361]|uniref:DUF6115 domain-containing protein n=1 Tax=Bacillus sp. AFS073361 TaxID=2033511 RepID=UPI000BF7578D|nr:hypothetical protein [Bacillus sp. AFS073361]PFP30799.1 hypothetical protein COJ96_02215 [Bacillus sp. AFS073361]
MQNYLNEILLGLNLIGVLYLVARGSSRRDIVSQREFYRSIVENNKKISPEIAELKRTIDEFKGTVQEYHTFFQQVREQQWGMEKPVDERSVQSRTISNNGQKLLVQDRYKEIFELREQGLSVEQIARKLEKEYDEVSFIIQFADKARA